MSAHVINSLFGSGAEPDADLIEAVRDSVRAFARKRDSQALGKQRQQTDEEWNEVAEAGWLGLLAAEERGGAALPVPVLAALYEALGRCGVTSNYAAIGVLALVALECCEPAPLRDQLVEQLVLGAARPVLCWQTANQEDERAMLFASASLSQHLVSTADRRDFVEFADVATHFCFPSRCEGQFGLVVVEQGAPGLAVSLQPGLTSGPMGTVTFEGAVSQSNFLPMASRDALNPAFLLARIAAAAQLAGLSERMLELTSDYVVQRVQFGKPIGANQVVQHRLVDMWGQKELARAAVDRASHACSAGMTTAEPAALAAKARAATAAEVVTRGAFQLHGAIGYTGEYALGDLAKACLSLIPWLGAAGAARRRFVQLEQQGG